jgi:hypothetical protein
MLLGRLSSNTSFPGRLLCPFGGCMRILHQDLGCAVAPRRLGHHISSLTR